MKLTRPFIAFAGLSAFSGLAQAQIAFQAPSNYPLVTQRPDWVEVGDFDGVNGPDLAVTVGGPQGVNGPEYVQVFNNLGNGQFLAGQQVPMGVNVGVAAAVAGDFDGDGDQDLAVSLKDSNTVSILTNTGGTLTPGIAIGVGGSEPRHMNAADLDGDGDLDLVTSNRESSNLSVLINSGGTFALSGTVTVGIEPRYLALGDLNGDGIQDIAVAAHDSRRVDVVFGNGAGGFGPITSYPVSLNNKPSGLMAADLDGDGDLDLAATSDENDAGFIMVMLNQGGTFTSSFFFNGGINPGAIVGRDFDLDGDTDLAVADEDSNVLATHANPGNGVFAGAGTTIPIGLHPSHLVAADLDGNGSPDLATVTRDSNQLTVVLNASSSAPIGASYCGPAVPNSTGLPGLMSATGSALALDNDLTLSASQLPPGAFAFFLAGQVQGFTPNLAGMQGTFCLAVPFARINSSLTLIGSGGTMSHALDLTAIPLTPSVAVLAGETWRFQCWYRDVNPNPTANLTDGWVLTFQ
tara:strand:+ start:11526 stop:13085 length:1560 start_codon:yes stop_codon:yes gene_type:complete